MGKHSAPEESKEPKIRFKSLRPWIARYRKSIVAVAQALLVAGFSVATDGISSEEWGYILLSAGAAVGVWAAPNKPNTVKDKNDYVQ